MAPRTPPTPTQPLAASDLPEGEVWDSGVTLCLMNLVEKLFPGEVLEIGVVDPALAYAFVGQPDKCA